MFRKLFYISLAFCIYLPGLALAAEQDSRLPAYMQDEVRLGSSNRFERGSVLYLNDARMANYKGQSVSARTVRQQDHGIALPDGRGGVIIIPGAEGPAQNPNLVDARELKLKMRELASQLLVGLPSSLSGHIALPTAFVQQDDFERSSSFGRFAVEQLYYEFNQRGLRTREYRMGKNMTVREDGEFILSRDVAAPTLNSNTIYVVGTYYTDGNVMFVNARLIRASGEILRTGQLVMPVSQLTRRMLANSGRRMPLGGLELKDFNTEARQPEAVTAFDRGLDIH